MPPVRATLVGRFSSIADGGLLIDLRPWIWAGFGVLVFSMIFWLPLIRSMTRAISQMTRATEQIAEGQFDVQVDEKRWDEIGRLGSAVNRMAARLAGFVTGQKRFLGDIAHELCSPLARMEMALGVMKQRTSDEMNERVEDVNEEVREMSDLVNELLSFSKAGLRAPDAPLQRVKLLEVAATMIEREQGQAEVINEVPEGMEVMAVESLLARAVANLVRNAVRYASDGGPITVSAIQKGSEVEVSVADRGPGVPDESLAQLFEAFYRPDAARSRETGGAGLGLAIVKTCVESMRGKVSATNREGGGLAVTITLDAPSHQKPKRSTVMIRRQDVQAFRQ
jgi:two-component system sensor histidine kinase CpxA